MLGGKAISIPEEGRMGMNRRRKKLFVLIAIAFCMILWFGTDVYAQGGGPCAEDIAKFCKDIQPGGGRLVKCMKEHEKELSAPCRQQIHESQKRWRETVQACHDDALKFCTDVKPGGGRLVQCLKEHPNELSVECKERLAQPRKNQ
jgi:hypothetical protein